ncbi:MAG: hypothetical protein ACRD8Z_15815 [Nitrososphaeraceae archaeon]
MSGSIELLLEAIDMMNSNIQQKESHKIIKTECDGAIQRIPLRQC